METIKDKVIAKAQQRAKELGHCLCNLKLECPCPNFNETGECICSEHIMQNPYKKTDAE